MTIEKDPASLIERGHKVVKHFQKAIYYDSLNRDPRDDIMMHDGALEDDAPGGPAIAASEDAPADAPLGGDITPGAEHDANLGGDITPGAEYDANPLSPPPAPPPPSPPGAPMGDRPADMDDEEGVEKDPETMLIEHMAGLFKLGMGARKTMRFGAHTLTLKSRPGARQWQASCPWHRKSKVTGCKSHWSVAFDASPEEHSNAIRKLMWWCINAQAYTRQRHHQLFRPDIAEGPADAVLEAREPDARPPGAPPTDQDLDAAEDVVAEPPASSAGRSGRGHGGGRRGRGRGRGPGRHGARGGGRGAVEAADVADSSDAAESGDSGSVAGPGSSDSEQTRAFGLEPKPRPPAGDASDSSSSGSSSSDS